MVRTVLLFLALTQCLAAFAHREDIYFLKGTIGDDEVAVRIDEFGDVCYARYFMLSNKQEQVLEGKIDSTSYLLYSYLFDTVTNTRKETSTLSVQQIKGHGWKGYFVDENGVRKPVEFQPIVMDSLKSEYVDLVNKNRVNPYTALRIADLKFKKTRSEKVGKGFKIRWYVEPISGVEMFRLEKGFPQDVRDSFNQILLSEHLLHAEQSFSCRTLLFNGSYNVQTHVEFINRHLISFGYEVSADCYGRGAKPISEFITYSIDSAKRLELEDLLWFGSGRPPRKGSMEWHKYRYGIFGKHILSVLKVAYPDHFISEKDGCNFDDERLWQFPYWHLTGEGLYIGAKSALLNLECDDSGWSVIPYPLVSKYLDPKYGLTK